jgi:nucleoside 2-deoxyribosyltransferase
MLEEQLKSYACTITVSKATSPNYLLATIKCKQINIDQQFTWLGHSSLLEATIKPRISRLMAGLSNGAVFNDALVYNVENLADFIESHFVRLTPDSKLDSVLLYINSKTEYDGQLVELKGPTMIDLAKLYFHNIQEWRFYFDNAIKESHIRREGFVRKALTGDQNYNKYALSVKGLSRLINVSEGKESNYCFVAMAFDDELNSVYTAAIEVALSRTDFRPIRVDRLNIPSDKTINDEIIAGIKKSRFTIADFTNHKDGVYFEAGYALGKGKKVIYCCRSDQMGKAHFDIRNYQHVVWTDPADFQEKLVNKIEAFIKD